VLSTYSHVSRFGIPGVVESISLSGCLGSNLPVVAEKPEGVEEVHAIIVKQFYVLVVYVTFLVVPLKRANQNQSRSFNAWRAGQTEETVAQLIRRNILSGFSQYVTFVFSIDLLCGTS